MARRLRSLALFAILALFAACGVPSASAAWLDAPFLDLPTNRVNRTGLRMQLDWYGPRHPGYQPVRVRIYTANGAPSPRDRELDVRLHPNSYGASSGGPLTVRKTITLAKGATSIDDTISIPIDQQLSYMSSEVYEDGQSLREFKNSGYYARVHGFEESLPPVLVVGAEAPTREQFNRTNMTSRFGSTAFDEFKIPEIGPLSNVATGNYYEPFYANENAKTIDYLTYLHTSNTQLYVLHPDDLPERWIDLTGYEVVILSWPDLEALRKNRPEAFAALRDWTLAGRTLMVYDLGMELQQLPRLEDVLEVERTKWSEGEAPIESVEPGNPLADRWFRPARTLRTQAIGLWSSTQGYRGSTYTAAPVGMDGATTTGDAETQAKDFVIATRRCHFGYVVAIGNEDAFPGTTDDWRWAFNSVPPNHLSWTQKHGMSYADVNVPFWRHRIPGVGVAPVWTFLALITAFVVLIGPANYFYLAKRRRLALLLLTVPIGSFAVILGLFAYAFFNDGLGTRSRIRSYSIVDSDAERTYSWSWQTYFAGIAPSQGIVLDESSYMAPLYFDPEAAINTRGRFEIVWNDGVQRLARGYLPSRTMSQFVGNGVREGNYSLAVRFPKEGGAPEVENLLGTDLSFLVCVGPDGTLYSAPGEVGKEATAKLVKVEPADVAKTFDHYVKASPLEIPEGVDAEALRSSEYRSGFFGWLTGYSPYYGNSGSAPLNVNETKFEQGIQRARTSLERNVPPLEPGTYYALAEAPPWLPYAVERHSREMNLDVVFGRY